MQRILFICKGNSGRALMGEAFALRMDLENVEIISATDSDEPTHPLAREVMREVGCDLPGRSLQLANVLNQTFDVIITLCVIMQENCPQFPGSPARVHWGLTDPLILAHEPLELLKHFRRTRDEIRNRVRDFFEHGYFDSIVELRLTFGKILNTMTDGVMAHDKNRSIFFFNHAAEEITGYKAVELLGRDCHTIIPGQFCGKDCDLCMKNPKVDQRLHIPVEFTRKDGEIRDLEISIMPMLAAENVRSGALVMLRDMTEMNRLRTRLEEGRGFQGIIGVHPSIQKIYTTIRYLAEVNVPILIQGESGTGKELVARALHQLSSRKDKPFVPLNCGALPEGTLESELFGHVKGAFTSAIRDKKGRFELADKGILFLDEIGEISFNVQVKLLRVIQENSFVPVGGEKAVDVDVSIICATNRDLKEMTTKGLFREDLYYRLAVVPIIMPTLRERKTDIPMLIDYFQEKFSRESGIRIKRLAPETLNALVNYRWPGNIRELANAIHYAMIQARGNEILLHHLPSEIVHTNDRSGILRKGRKPKLLAGEVESVMRRTAGNKAKAAQLLGVSRTTLYRYLETIEV